MKTRTLSRLPTRHFLPPPPTLTSTSPPLHRLQTTPSPYPSRLRALLSSLQHREVAFLPKVLGTALASRPPRVTFAVFAISGYIREKTLRLWCVYTVLASPTDLQGLMCVPVQHNTQITDALKTSENSTSPYITYIIRSGVSLCRPSTL